MALGRQPFVGVLLLATTSLGNLSSCRRKFRPPASHIETAASKTASQLLFGFYDVEQHSYRWTGRSFAIALGPPSNPRQEPMFLQAQVFIPDSEIKRLGVMTLAASIPGHQLGSKRILKGGLQEYSASIPRSALCTNLLPVSFSFDRAIPPSPSDARELGAVAISFALAVK